MVKKANNRPEWAVEMESTYEGLRSWIRDRNSKLIIVIATGNHDEGHFKQLPADAEKAVKLVNHLNQTGFTFD